jgi:hypothetical protein
MSVVSNGEERINFSSVIADKTSFFSLYSLSSRYSLFIKNTLTRNTFNRNIEERNFTASAIPPPVMVALHIE